MKVLHGGGLAQAGFSLVELMISLTVGMVVIAAMTTMFVQSSRVRNSNERANRQTESGRYALQLISADLQQAGYYDAYDPDPSAKTYLAPPASKPDPCSTTLTDLAAAIAVPIQAYDSPATNPLTCISDWKTGTDILVIRRVSNCVAGPTADAGCDAAAAGDYLFQASLCKNEIGVANYFKLDTNSANLTLHKQNCTTVANYRRLLVRIYYVANNNKAGDGVPTLKRVELGSGGMSATPQPLVDGIEDLQVEYGIDTTPTSGSGAAIVLNGDGIADVVTADPDSYGSCSNLTHPSCTQYWQAVVSANVHVLARNINSNPGYQDTKTYTLGLTSAGAANTRGPYNDGFGRHVFQSVVRIYNSNWRRQTQ
ncbi:MAG TPA: PilW family protein [Nevskia sp.]|nr:PilW family protein [Nevskia sp.]